MISSEANLIVEVWEHVRENLPSGKRHEIAVNILRSFVEFGFEKDDMADIVDEDDILHTAFVEVFDEGEEYDEEDDDENPWR